MSRSALATLALVLAVGCASTIYRATDPTSPECSDTAYGKEYAGLREAACMLAKGRSAFVTPPWRFGDVRVQLTVQSVRAVSEAKAFEDLLACSGAANSVQTPTETTAYRALFGVGALFQELPMEGKIVAAFRNCIDPRGYTVHRWQPESNP